MTKPTYEELQAQVERLRDYIMRGSPWNTNPEKCERRLVLSETPAQSLAALKAQWRKELAGNLTVEIERSKSRSSEDKEMEHRFR